MRMPMRILVLAGCCWALQVYEVSNDNDSGDGSLRWAINGANANAGADEITFVDDGGHMTIYVVTQLPSITEAVHLHGNVTLDGVRKIDVRAVGLFLSGHSGSVIEGLTLQNFGDAGVSSFGGGGSHTLRRLTVTNSASDGIYVPADGSVVEHCVVSGNNRLGIIVAANSVTLRYNYIGVEKDGATASPNGLDGMQISGNNNIVGPGNVVSGNFRMGILLVAHNTSVFGNIVGLDADGQFAVPNGLDGIQSQLDNNRFGGAREGDGNVVSGNSGRGILVIGKMAVIYGNTIGVSKNGLYAVGNMLSGVEVYGSGAQIEANLISGNSLHGVSLLSSASAAVVVNNIVGLNRVGDAVIPNEATGVFTSADGTQIKSNLVSGNTIWNVYSTGIRAQVVNNVIGADATKNSVFNGTTSGVRMDGAGSVVARNVIAGVDKISVELGGVDAIVRGNYFGCNENMTALGSTSVHLNLISSVVNCTVGGNLSSENRNVFMRATEAAIRIYARATTISGNDFVANLQDGIVVLNGPVFTANNQFWGGFGHALTISAVAQQPVFFTNNTVWEHLLPGIQDLRTNAPPTPILFSATNASARLLVPAVAGAHTVSVELFGSARSTKAYFSHQVGHVSLLRFTLPSNSSMIGTRVPFTVDVTVPASVMYLTAVATFDNVGSSVFSPSLAVTRDTRACAVCQCYNTTVDCGGQRLNFVPSAIPSNTTILDLSDNLLRNLDDSDWIRVLSLPFLRVLQLKAAELTLFGVGTSCNSLEVLDLSNNFLKALPNLATVAPNLVRLNLLGNAGLVVHGAAFADMAFLEDLNLARCGLVNLPDGVFDTQSAILTLDLSENNLRVISNGILSTKLQSLNFFSATQNVSGLIPRVDVSNLQGLQGMFWVDNNCAAGFYGVGQRVCLRCPYGTHKGAGADGRPACAPCAAGTVDDDYHAQTPCAQCPAGSFSGAGSSGTCGVCPAGTTDDDRNPSTPCVPCASGAYTAAGSKGPCLASQCARGTSDDDQNAATACRACPAGTFTEVGSSRECAQHVCPAGYLDSDSNASTPCVVCDVVGRFVPVGQVGNCSTGNFSCAAGTYDHDSQSATPCIPVPQPANTGVSSASRGAIAGAVVTVAVAVAGLVLFVWGARRRQHLKNTRPYLFDDVVAELRKQGLVGDLLALDATPRELKRGAVKLLAKIGDGAFGTVHKAILNEHATTGVPEYTVAVKMLRNDPTFSETKEFMREAALMAQFKHPHVVSLIGVVTTGAPAMVLLQFCEHGSLLSFLQQRSGFAALQLESKLTIMLDVARGMGYLAGQHVVHRDLAARNVLVGADYACKVSDFGLSREVEAGAADYYSTARGMVPLRWTAPEALKTRHYSTWSDIWAFGILCGEVFDDGATPYVGMTDERVWLHVSAGNAISCPLTCPAPFYDNILCPCFNAVPSTRHPFITLCKKLNDSRQRMSMSQSPTVAPRKPPLDAGFRPMAHGSQLDDINQQKPQKASVGAETARYYALALPGVVDEFDDADVGQREADADADMTALRMLHRYDDSGDGGGSGIFLDALQSRGATPASRACRLRDRVASVTILGPAAAAGKDSPHASDEHTV